MKKPFLLMSLAALALAGSAMAYMPSVGELTITNPANSQSYAPGTSVLPVFWTSDPAASLYELQVVHNDHLFTNVFSATPDVTLNQVMSPGYYSLFVRGSNDLGNGPWSTGVTVMVRRNMTPDGTATNRQPKVFKWSRSTPASRYLFQLSQFNKSTGKYVVKLTLWIPQPPTGDPKWTASKIPDGKYRWTVTDYRKDKSGYTQAAAFRILNSGFHSWNDPALIKGKWKVLTSWRWGELTFQADGVLRTTQPNGVSFTRARWYADENTLTLISDVTEHCPYTVRANTLVFKLPSGNVKELVRIP